VLHEEFVHWFDLATAGSREHYQQVASQIWRIWQERPRRDDGVTPVVSAWEGEPARI